MNMKNMKMKTKTVIIDNMGSSHWSDSKKSEKHVCVYNITVFYIISKRMRKSIFLASCDTETTTCHPIWTQLTFADFGYTV